MSELAYGNYSLLDNQQESPLYTAKYDYTALGKFLSIDLTRNKSIEKKSFSFRILIVCV